MAREGYLILDSDLHMMEPDDLWVHYLDEPYRSSNPPRFFGGQLQKLAESSEDKGNADVIEGSLARDAAFSALPVSRWQDAGMGSAWRLSRRLSPLVRARTGTSEWDFRKAQGTTQLESASSRTVAVMSIALPNDLGRLRGDRVNLTQWLQYGQAGMG
jgi:hypothetical protein